MAIAEAATWFDGFAPEFSAMTPALASAAAGVNAALPYVAAGLTLTTLTWGAIRGADKAMQNMKTSNVSANNQELVMDSWAAGGFGPPIVVPSQKPAALSSTKTSATAAGVSSAALVAGMKGPEVMNGETTVNILRQTGQAIRGFGGGSFWFLGRGPNLPNEPPGGLGKALKVAGYTIGALGTPRTLANEVDRITDIGFSQLMHQTPYGVSTLYNLGKWGSYVQTGIIDSGIAAWNWFSNNCSVGDLGACGIKASHTLESAIRRKLGKSDAPASPEQNYDFYSLLHNKQSNAVPSTPHGNNYADAKPPISTGKPKNLAKNNLNPAGPGRTPTIGMT